MATGTNAAMSWHTVVSTALGELTRTVIPALSVNC